MNDFVVLTAATLELPDDDPADQPPLEPMEARLVDEIPAGEKWQYVPKWDGFRCLAFRDDDSVYLQSKSGQPLARYFPELVEQLRELKSRRFVLDGEILIPVSGRTSFDPCCCRPQRTDIAAHGRIRDDGRCVRGHTCDR